MVLVIGGVLLLLDTFGIFKGGALFWTIISVVAGLLFLSLFITNRDNWWALIPGIIFLAIAAMVGLNLFVPGFSETNYSGTIILGGIALSFLLVYIAERSNWWAIIPADVMATIAICRNSGFKYVQYRERWHILPWARDHIRFGSNFTGH
jgi:hypothetical protein